MSATYVDRGGTFTDVVTVDASGAVVIRKVRSDRAVVGALARGDLTFGTTVATNALLERTGAPTLLVVTEGFTDLAWIGDQTRPALFDPDARWPEPLCQRAVAVGGRVASDGTEIEPLAFDRRRLLEAVDSGPFTAVAIVLLNSHRAPAHELAVARFLRQARPEVFVSLGHETSPELGYLARVETTLVDAAITPILQRSLTRDRIPPGALATRSDGSLCPAESLRAPDAVLSGPAGGVLAVAAVAAQAGVARAVGLDMGGTSTDVCRVDVGALPRREGDIRVAGVRLRRPMLEVDTIAAGGGSILAFDGQRLTVGPESAGAAPGPQCYGRGGPPTLTDAALASGLVQADAFDPPLDPDRVELPGDAAAFLAIAREAMAQAVRRLALARGIDVTDHALVSYGGAAGQHAAEVARLLGIQTVLVHPCAAVLSAWGQAMAPREEAAVRALWRPLDDTGWEAVELTLEALTASLPALGTCHATVELRYAGTDHPIELPAAGGDASSMATRFETAHRARFGFHRPELPIEIVNVRVRVSAPARPLPPVQDDPWGLQDRTLDGPALVTTPTTAVHVPAGWSARRHRGLLWLEEQAPAAAPMPRERTPWGVELWSNRFQAVAEEAGTVLQRLARSVNIRERLDFSCAIFDGTGQLVANAPHIPVHLGAMGETVRDLIASHPDAPIGQAWLSNDPGAGGSHLPDLTVVSAVDAGLGQRWYVACRGHHVDVGGLTPGSMPPHSTALHEEGFCVRHLPLLEPDGAGLRDVRGALVGCRELDTVLADLRAQIASNAHAARLLTGLGPADVVSAWMAHLRDVADEAVAAIIDALPGGHAEDEIDGVPLSLRLVPADGGLVVDLTGCGPPHPGNLNAPRAVVRAAVLYSLRVLVGRDIPLNEGALRRVRIETRAPSIVAPPIGAAVAGGNVETSQRLVDLFLRAAGARAASQGTMNNLTLGGLDGDGRRWSLYETIGGGTGASASGPGPSGRQVHMTNTRATDPEVLEARLPVRLREFACRAGSGGDGLHRGGDGLRRTLEITRPGVAALLASRRRAGAAGLEAGGDGMAARDRIRRPGGEWRPWDRAAVELPAGTLVQIETPGGGGWGPKSGPQEERT